MKIASFKVGTRLGFGFALLLLIAMIIGAVGLVRLSQLDAVVMRLTNEEWQSARLAMEMQIRTRDNAFKTATMLMAGDDIEAIGTLRAQMAKNSEANSAALEQLEKLMHANARQLIG